MQTSLKDRDNQQSDPVALLEKLRRLEAEHAAKLDLVGRLDHVTLLPNRLQFSEDFQALNEKRQHYLVLLTLTDPKHFNELLRALGHPYAEDFVRAGAERLRTLLAPSLTIYHVSVLSFAFLIQDVSGQDGPRIASEIVQAFRQPVTCHDIPLSMRPGVGIASIEALTADVGELLRSTLAAAQDSRRLTKGWSHYDRKSDEAHLRAFRLLLDMPSAFSSPDQLHLLFQPRIGLRSRTCVSAEALVRWTHPQFGPISPGEFIPLVESTALIDPLTDWIVDRAFGMALLWQKETPGIKISVNISPRSLDDMEFPDRLDEAANRIGVDPQLIELEFTEGMLMSNWAIVTAQMKRIRRSGFNIAIDDFGSGYSNMSSLGNIPAQHLKIDQSFVRSMRDDQRLQILARNIIELAHALRYQVVAEGIENAETLQMLADWDCDEGQGFHISRPQSGTDFVNWLRQAV